MSESKGSELKSRISCSCSLLANCGDCMSAMNPSEDDTAAAAERFARRIERVKGMKVVAEPRKARVLRHRGALQDLERLLVKVSEN